MTLDSTKDILFLVLAFASIWIAVFVCWCLFEIARLFHQTNEVVAETRERVHRVERAVVSIKDKLESSANYLGILAEGGKAVMGMLHKREEKKKGKK